jgi:hypothetical protein
MKPKEPSTQQRGLDAVIKYEHDQGRKAKRVHKCGYDLCSTGKGGERHIEVKATTKDRFTSRWLEQMEYDQLTKDPAFYLYLVTDVLNLPLIFVYDRTKLQNCFDEQISKYVFKFRREDFRNPMP